MSINKEVKKDKIKVSNPKLNLPKELIGLEFRVLDNMTLENIFIIYHFCLLGLEMTKNVEMNNVKKSTLFRFLVMKIFEIADTIIVTGIKISISVMSGLKILKADNIMDVEWPTVKKVIIQNNLLKFLNENGIVIETIKRKWSYALISRICINPNFK